MHDITLAELYACTAGGEMLVAERFSDGAFLHISDAVSGLACGCICPGCGKSVVARKGKRRMHTFAHMAYSQAECRRSGETALHRFAKELLVRERRLKLPPVTVSDNLGPIEVTLGGVLEFDAAILERRLDDVIPDVICQRAGRDLHVEFRVTHACDDKKTAKLKAMGAGAIEIDLSPYREFPIRELGEVILELADRAWINTRMIETGERLLKERQEAVERDLNIHAARVAVAYQAFLEPEPDEEGTWEERAHEHDLGFLVDMPQPTRSCFSVRGGEWKGFALLQYGFRRRSGFSPNDLHAEMVKYGWIAPPFDQIPPAVAERVRETCPGFLSPREEVQRYISDLEGLSFFLVSSHGKISADEKLVRIVQESGGSMATQSRPWVQDHPFGRGPTSRFRQKRL